jgi:uncharacterized protein YecT (DUF1311 family)
VVTHESLSLLHNPPRSDISDVGCRPCKDWNTRRGTPDNALVSRIFVITPLALTAALPAEAEMFGPSFQPCGDQLSTPAVVECVQAKTNAADQRLNAVYKALQARVAPPQRQPLLSAQRLGVQYRDANCGFYGTQDGSIRQVQGAECIRSMQCWWWSAQAVVKLAGYRR